MFRDSGGSISAAAIEKMAQGAIESHPECSIDYVAVVDRRTLRPVLQADQDSMLLLAVKINNKVRLIDNAPMQEEP